MSFADQFLQAQDEDDDLFMGADGDEYELTHNPWAIETSCSI